MQEIPYWTVVAEGGQPTDDICSLDSIPKGLAMTGGLRAMIFWDSNL